MTNLPHHDRPDRPVPPQRPTKPSTASDKQGGSLLTILVAAVLGLAIFAAAFVLLMQIALALAAALILIILAATFHYFVWGRWLSDAIRREVEEEEESERQHRR